MQYGNQQRRSSWGVVIVIVLILGLFFVGGLAVLGVGLFVAARTNDVHRRVERDMALQHAQAVREEISAAQAEAMAQAAEAQSDFAQAHHALELADATAREDGPETDPRRQSGNHSEIGPRWEDRRGWQGRRTE